MQYKVIWRWFPILEIFSQRELKKDVAIPFAFRVMRIREHYEACDERRRLLVERHGIKKENEIVVGDDGKVEMESKPAFERDWKDLLNVKVEDYPEFTQKLSKDDVPEGTSSLEIEALFRLRLLDKPEAFE